MDAMILGAPSPIRNDPTVSTALPGAAEGTCKVAGWAAKATDDKGMLAAATALPTRKRRRCTARPPEHRPSRLEGAQ